MGVWHVHLLEAGEVDHNVDDTCQTKNQQRHESAHAFQNSIYRFDF